ncbi:MAG: hypothetical protein QOG25_4144 [Acetobacteraceae bacterium]|jgi:hypothetical protein|nr:hypothetical protein [Acetobacteraceae bacterium]
MVSAITHHATAEAALHMMLGKKSGKSWIRPDRNRILGFGDECRGPLHCHFLQDVNTAGHRFQLHRTLLIVDRHDMPKLHHDEAAGGNFERNPAHRAPREIISLI